MYYPKYIINKKKINCTNDFWLHSFKILIEGSNSIDILSKINLLLLSK